MSAKPEQQSEPWFKIRKVKELRKEFPEPDKEVIKGFAQRRDVFNVIAPSKIGKSLFVSQQAICFVGGKEWLGYEFDDDGSGRVLIIDNELKEYEIWARLHEQAKRLGVDPALVDERIDVLALRDAEHEVSITQIEDQIKAHVPPGYYRIVNIDSVYRALGKNKSENDASHMAEFYRAASRIGKHLDALVNCVHHTSKGSQSEKDVVDVGSGTGVISRAVDGHVVLRYHEEDGCVVMDAKLRYKKSPDSLGLRRDELVWTVDGSIDTAKLRTTAQSKISRTDLIEIFKENSWKQLQRHELIQKVCERTNCVDRTAKDYISKQVKPGGCLEKFDTGNNTYKCMLTKKVMDTLTPEFKADVPQPHPASLPPAGWQPAAPVTVTVTVDTPVGDIL